MSLALRDLRDFLQCASGEQGSAQSTHSALKAVALPTAGQSLTTQLCSLSHVTWTLELPVSALSSDETFVASEQVTELGVVVSDSDTVRVIALGLYE